MTIIHSDPCPSLRKCIYCPPVPPIPGRRFQSMVLTLNPPESMQDWSAYLVDWNRPGRRFQSMIWSLNPCTSMRDWNANCRTGTVPATGSSQPFTRNCGLEPLTPFGLYNIIQREVGVCGTGWPVRMSTVALYASLCSIWGAALSA